ncbi:MAG: hypothetical protein HFE73_02735 [Firmicutes bacterium]|nr:hypothetical protein [Bacillota bacterium]
MDMNIFYFFLTASVGGIGGALYLYGKEMEEGNRGTVMGWIRATGVRLGDSRVIRIALLHRWTEMMERRKGRRMDQEIFDGGMLLKNLAIVEKERTFSADYIYETLMDNSHILKPIYGEMLSLYRGGKDREAFQVWREKCGTRAARNFSMILEKVGQINPEALIEQMEVFQEMMYQQRVTADMEQVERNSLITTLMATAVILIMLIDFAVVVVFLHTMEMIGGTF